MWKTINLKYIAVLVFLYIYLFQPPVINKYLIITGEIFIFSVYYIFNRTSIINTFSLLRKELLILFSIGGYVICRDIFQGELVYSERIFAWIFQGFFLPIILCDYFSKQSNKLKYNPLNLLFVVAGIGALLSWLLFLVPQFDNWYRSFGITELEKYANFEQRYRGYGITENITFTYSLVMGVFSGLSFIRIKENIMYFFLFFLFLFALILNARVGLTVVLFLIFYALFFQKKGLLVYFKAFSIGLVSFLILTIAFPSWLDLFTFNISWVLDFFYDLSGSSKVESGTIETLFTSFLIFPTDFIGWIFGYGESLFNNDFGNNSDVGFILQLYYGGILLITLLSIFILYSFVRLISKLGYKHYFPYLYLFVLIVFNIKGFFFAATPGARLIFFLYIYYINYESKYIQR